MRGTAQGFTLVELLVVMMIVSVLAVIVALIINPIEILQRGRDENRLIDLANLQKAINMAIQDNQVLTSGQLMCAGGLSGGKCTDRSNNDPAAAVKIDGNGWVKINISNVSSITLPALPLDPTNSDAYHYTYCSNGYSWEMDSVLESDKFKDKMILDGGNETDKYEIGSDLTLISPLGLCQY